MAIQKIEDQPVPDITERHLEAVAGNVNDGSQIPGFEIEQTIDLPIDPETRSRRMLMAAGIGILAVETSYAFIEGFSRRGSSTEGALHVAGHIISKVWDKVSFL